jgi:hypothetical protein
VVRTPLLLQQQHLSCRLLPLLPLPLRAAAASAAAAERGGCAEVPHACCLAHLLVLQPLQQQLQGLPAPRQPTLSTIHLLQHAAQ